MSILAFKPNFDGNNETFGEIFIKVPILYKYQLASGKPLIVNNYDGQ